MIKLTKVRKFYKHTTKLDDKILQVEKQKVGKDDQNYFYNICIRITYACLQRDVTKMFYKLMDMYNKQTIIRLLYEIICTVATTAAPLTTALKVSAVL